MAIIFLLRFVNIVIVLLVFTQVNLVTWYSLVYALGFTHYFVSLVYSKRQLAESATLLSLSVIPLLSVIVMGAGLYFLQLPLLFYFAIHHAFNEAYIPRQTIPSDRLAVARFRGSSVLLHLFIYLFILRCTPNAGFQDSAFYVFSFGNSCDQGFGDTHFLLACVAVSYVIFFFYLYRIRSLLSLQTLIENCAFELLGLAAIAASFYIKFDFLQIVFYHFVFWTLFPLPKMLSAGAKTIQIYVGLTIVCLALFLVISPSGPNELGVSVSSTVFQDQFLIWSYIHITLSFALSNSHPNWIVALFRPRVESA